MIGDREDPLLAGLPESQYAISDGRWKLVEAFATAGAPAERQLFDREADPLDQNNLASEHPEVVAALAEQLEAWRSWAQERMLEPDSVDNLSAEELARLRSLGYI